MTGHNGRTVRDLRRGNRGAVLRRLYFDGPLSRQELGPATGLSSGSVSNVVGELVAEGLVEEAGIVDSDGGRPRTLLRVAPAGGLLVGVDVGETRVRVELFDLTLTELARTEMPLVPRGDYDVARVVDHVRTGIARVLAEAGTGPGDERLIGVGLGVPGIVEHRPEQGAVIHGQTIGWDAVPLEELLRAADAVPAHVPVHIDNGARTLGQAEMWFGAGRGARRAVVVLFGSGVGAALFTEDGVRGGGTVGTALEWGHVTVHVRGRRCRCGARGCLEAYAGAESVLARWTERVTGIEAGAGVAERAWERSGDQEEALAELLRRAEAGDRAAGEVLEETAEYLGAGLSDVINLFRPERILIGGWAGLLLAPRILAPVREHARAYALRHPAGRVEIERGALGPDAVTVGAAALPLAAFFAGGGRRTPPPPPAREPLTAPRLRTGG
ncbi:ROK family protein (plasmid) [Streptomyces sp. BI20]|uniref:ROK family transcriptional regulator n=1 Tax=Streptomyces sp. BI20 TaxID=3403460 RepID=UPI003C72042A